MKYIIFLGIIIFLIVFVVLYLIKRKQAICKVKEMNALEKLDIVNKALNPFGFTYLYNEDIVISLSDSWQKNMGYSDFYDLKAPFINIVMDAEPIIFYFNDKLYRIEFWKGQYGVTTGAEIGMYVKNPETNMYQACSDEEIIPIQFKLYKKCKLLERHGFTWWLTGFKVGEFSSRKSLVLKSCLYFSNPQMMKAFICGLLDAGYKASEFKVFGNMVFFSICKPKNYKLNHRHKILKVFVQLLNFLNCKIFMWITRFFNRTLDKLVYISLMNPFIYHIIIKLSIPRVKQKKYLKKIS